MVIFQSAPYIMYRKIPDDGTPWIGNDKFEGFCADLAERVAHEVGFEYIIRLVRDSKYGARMEGGKWNGMVGELTQRVLMLSLNHFTVCGL